MNESHVGEESCSCSPPNPPPQTKRVLKEDVVDMRGYLWHQGFGHQVGLLRLFGPVQILVSPANIHVCTNIICRGQHKACNLSRHCNVRLKFRTDELMTDDLQGRKWLSDRRVYTINLEETFLGGEPMKNVDVSADKRLPDG